MDIEKKRKKQTFIVEIIDRQKYTWQGQIHWIEKNEKVSFRSVMEMLRLMDSAFEEDEAGEQQEEKQE